MEGFPLSNNQQTDPVSPTPAGHGRQTAAGGRSRKLLNRRSVTGIVAGAAASAALAGGIFVAVTSGAAPAAEASATSLIVMPSPDGPFTDDFNPFDSSSSPVGDGAVSMIYEPLLMFNDLKANSVTPWLASRYSFADGGKVLTFFLHSGVKWSDGTPFSSADVAFTFKMLKSHPSINGSGINPTSITTPNANEVVLKFSAPQYVNLVNIAQTPIVPEHIWSKVNPVTYSDPKPVGTGPYLLERFSPESFTLVRNPHYWQRGLPKVQTLVYPGYDSNSSALGAFASADWSSLFEPDVQRLYVAPGHGNNHYWFPPVSTVALLPNLQKYPLDKVDVRKAISMAIDRATVDKDGEDGYEPPVTNLGGIIPGQSSYIDQSIPGIKPVYNPAEAKRLLKAAGLKMGHNGYFLSSNGRPITLNLVVPSAFTDWAADTTVISAELKSVGLNVNVDATAVNTWTSDAATGNYDLTIDGADAGPSPYYMYYAWLDSAFTAPEGKTAISDYTRWSSPETNKLLAQFAGTDNAAVQKQAMIGLERVMASNLPFIPLVYNVAWDEYSTKLVTGWPDAADPYMVPAGYDKPGDELVVLHLTPR